MDAWCPVLSRHTKVANFSNAIFRNENILWLQILQSNPFYSMEYEFAMQKVQSVEYVWPQYLDVLLFIKLWHLTQGSMDVQHEF